MVEETGGPVLPADFVAFRNLTRIHLKQILKLDRVTSKVPMHAVALLVMVAYEALAKFTDPPPGTKKEDTHWLFAKRHYEQYQIDPAIGARIFKALRHGLAHRYGHYPVPVAGLGDIRLVLIWREGGPHLRGVATAVVDGEQWLYPLPKKSSDLPRALCINVVSLWEDLDRLFTETNATLAADRDAAGRYEQRVAENAQWQAGRLAGSDPAVWRVLLSSRRLEADE
jgi:hypothetical protein